MVEAADEARQKEIDDSRRLGSKIVATNWVYHAPSPLDQIYAALRCNVSE